MKIGDVKDPRQQQAQEFGMKIGLLPPQMGGKIGDVKDPRQQQAQEFGMKIGLLPAQMGGTKSYYEVEPYHK